MIQAFDNAAIDYDREFTESHIGRMLRQRVWSYMDRILMGSRKAEILELNCGTGEDAVFFARRGHRVTATDSSQEMIRMASQKVGKAGLKASVELETLDIRDVARPLGNNSSWSHANRDDGTEPRLTDRICPSILRTSLVTGDSLSAAMNAISCSQYSCHSMSPMSWINNRSTSFGLALSVNVLPKR